MDLRIISIGALGAHPLRDERDPVRTGHATTTLIRADGRTLLVDPGLPDQALLARLEERTGLTPDAVTDVFLTSFQPDVFRGITPFQNADWWIGDSEREQVGIPLITHLKRAADDGQQELLEALQRDIAILNQCKPAPDRLLPGVDLFPMPGVTPGLTGLILNEAARTTLICGDAVPTVEHLEAGKVLNSAANLDTARESFAEAIEIADLLVPGRDNLIINPVRRPF